MRREHGLAPVAAALLVWGTALAGDDPGRLAGRYCGVIVSGGEELPGLTEFSVAGEEISGDYIFLDTSNGDAPTPGTLSECSFADDGELSCLWTDNFGSGSLTVRFAEDADSFSGYWSPPETNGVFFPWNGVRMEAEATEHDCLRPLGQMT